jgi:hypothetical protein
MWVVPRKILVLSQKIWVLPAQEGGYGGSNHVKTHISRLTKVVVDVSRWTGVKAPTTVRLMEGENPGNLTKFFGGFCWAIPPAIEIQWMGQRNPNHQLIGGAHPIILFGL